MDGFDIRNEKFLTYILPNAPLEELGSDCRWLEGPAWFADQERLLVSDIPNDRIMSWTEGSGFTIFRQPSQFANGHTRDMQGRLVGCSHHDRCVRRTEPDGAVTILADRFEGKRLNAPNDVVVKSDGTIWFSDPTFGINVDYEGGKQESETPPALYCFNPANRILTRVIDTLQQPNGLCFSPNEQHLYVVSSQEQFAPNSAHSIRIYDVAPGVPRLENERFFYTADQGQADGIRCDIDGNVWAACGDGVHCISPAGKLLGKILVPHVCSNLAFGGRNRSRLFICGSHTLYAIYTNTRGAQRP